MKHASWAFAALLLLILAMAAKPMLLTLPEPAAQPGIGSFDTQRAIGRLARILGDERPHPVDSAANDDVRERLIGELKAMGLKPFVVDAFTCNGVEKSRAVGCARIRNVRVTIGQGSGRHLLLASHYDSTPVGPGAADDGIGMAVMLETAWLMKDHPLARPVTFLFDEGEELQLDGARAFLQRDPLAAQVDSAINLEARGVTGPAIMFETSRPNGAAIAAFQASAWRPVANSLTADFYRLIPNDTDVSVFRDRGWTILNFAIIGNESRYHSAGDTIAALDPRSVQHMGVQTLRAAETLAGNPPQASGERLYADLLGRGLVVLPMAIGLALLGLLAVAAAGLGWKRRGGIGRALVTILLSLLVPAILAFLLATGVGMARGGAFWRAHPGTIAVALDLTALAGAASLLALRASDRTRLRAAFWLVFLLIGILLTAIAPGASIFFLAPPALAFAGMALASRLRGTEKAAGWLAWLLLFLTWAPLIHMIEVLLDFGIGWLFALLSALVLLPALIEFRLARLPARPLALILAALALAGWVAVLLVPAYSADRKQAFGIFYLREARSARWLLANDGAPLPAAYAGFEKNAKLPWSKRPYWGKPAPTLPLAAPMFEKLGERATPLGRIVRLRFHASGNDSLVLLGAPDARFLAARAGGSVGRFGKGKADDPFFLRCAGRGCDGQIVDLLIGRRDRFDAKLIGIRYALPARAAPWIAARPATAAPHYTPDETLSVVDVPI